MRYSCHYVYPTICRFNRLRKLSLKRRELTVVLEVGLVDTGMEGLEDTVTN